MTSVFRKYRTLFPKFTDDKVCLFCGKDPLNNTDCCNTYHLLDLWQISGAGHLSLKICNNCYSIYSPDTNDTIRCGGKIYDLNEVKLIL